MDEKVFDIPFGNLQLKISAFIKDNPGEWILFLHGIQSNKKLFNELIGQDFLQKYSILIIDFVGFGNSSKPEDFSYDIADQTKVCKKIIEQLGIKKLHLIGHSLGGIVGTLLLELLKDKVISFINLEGNLVYEDAGLSREVAEYSFEEFNNKYEQIKNDIRNSSQSSAEKRGEWLQQIPDYVFYKTCRSIIEWSKKEILFKTFVESKVKKLFVYGDQNKEKADKLPDSIEKAEIPNSGHFMLLDNPTICSQLIRKFLSNQ